MLRRSLLVVSTAALLLVSAACTADDDAPDSTETSEPTGAALTPVTADLLAGVTFPTDLVPSGAVTLEGGEHSEEAAPGSASRIEFTTEMSVVDDLNEDGVDDGAIIVRSSGGGSGTSFDLHVFLAAEGAPRLIASESLGDRIEVQGIESGPSGVTVVYLTRPSDAPMTDPPTVEATTTVSIAQDGTVRVSQSGSGSATPEATSSATPEPSVTPEPAGDACADLAPEAADAAFVFVTNVTSGDTLQSGDTVEGCSRTFESHVPWYLVDREGDTIAESFTMGGGVDGAAPFEFTVEYEVDEAQVGHLFVGGDDPSGGEGFPPSLNQIPVVLLP